MSFRRLKQKINKLWLFGWTVPIYMILLGACTQTAEHNNAPTEQPRAASITTARLVGANAQPDQWLTYGGNYEEQRYSQLKQITKDNINQLGLAWFADYDTNLQQEGTPLYIDGVLYISTAWSKLYAFDAETGKQLWKYDPKVPGEWAVNVCCGLVNRGIAAYNGKIYIGTLDGRLVAVDAESGKKV